MRHPRDFWTAARQDTLKTMAEEGFSGGVIAKRLGCSRNAVIGRARREGITLGGHGSGQTLRPHDVCLIAKRAAEKGPKLAGVYGEYRSPPRPAHALDFSFAELDDGRRDCRYVYGEGEGKLFCGRPAVRGTSYCSKCAEIAYWKPKVDKVAALTSS